MFKFISISSLLSRKFHLQTSQNKMLSNSLSEKEIKDFLQKKLSPEKEAHIHRLIAQDKQLAEKIEFYEALLEGLWALRKEEVKEKLNPSKDSCLSSYFKKSYTFL